MHHFYSGAFVFLNILLYICKNLKKNNMWSIFFISLYLSASISFFGVAILVDEPDLDSVFYTFIILFMIIFVLFATPYIKSKRAQIELMIRVEEENARLENERRIAQAEKEEKERIDKEQKELEIKRQKEQEEKLAREQKERDIAEQQMLGNSVSGKNSHLIFDNYLVIPCGHITPNFVNNLNVLYLTAYCQYSILDHTCFIHIEDGKKAFQIKRQETFSKLYKRSIRENVSGILEIRKDGNYKMVDSNWNQRQYTITFHCDLPIEVKNERNQINREITLEERAKQLANSYLSTDKDKGFDTSNNVDKDYILNNILSSKCFYCGVDDFRLLGCDRINNSLPHSKDNVICACKNCNSERNNRFSVYGYMEYREFKARKQKEKELAIKA